LIPKVVQKKTQAADGKSRWDNGHDLGGLMRYLSGPGTANEHTDPHLVASSGTLAVEYSGLSMQEWQGGAARELGRIVEGAWREAHAGKERASQANDRGHVFHVSLSLHRDEGQLDDATWGQIASDYVDAMGFSSASGKAECQWVGVRHGVSGGGNDHIHLAVCLVREDGTWASDYQSKSRSQKVARELESKYGLRPLHDHADDRGLPGVHRAETERAVRAGRSEPERVTLARVVRAAAAQAGDEREFVAGVLSHGARIRPRFAAGGRESVVGYSVAMRAGDSGPEPLWFGGGQLAKDLTLPSLRQRWSTTGEQQQEALPTWRGEAGIATERLPSTRPAQWWELAAADIEAANRGLAAVDVNDVAVWQATAADAAGVFAEWSLRVEGANPGPLSAASDALARSAQWQRGSAPSSRSGPALAGRHLQMAARGTSQRSLQGWRGVMRQLDRTTQAIHGAHVARGEAIAAQRVAQAAGEGLGNIRAQMRQLEVAALSAPATRSRPRPGQQQGRDTERDQGK
jgi:hypothetical protein